MFNLKNVTVLTKAQQKNVRGGQLCGFIIKGKNGTQSQLRSGFPEGEEGSRIANNICVDLVINNPDVTSCRYNCSYDGWLE